MKNIAKGQRLAITFDKNDGTLSDSSGQRCLHLEAGLAALNYLKENLLSTLMNHLVFPSEMYVAEQIRIIWNHFKL